MADLGESLGNSRLPQDRGGVPLHAGMWQPSSDGCSAGFLGWLQLAGGQVRHDDQWTGRLVLRS